MSLPGDIQRYLLIVLAAVLAVAGLFVVSGALGGSSDSGEQNAQQVLEKAFAAAPADRDSGKINGSLTVNVAGPEAAAVGLSRPFEMTLNGFVNEPRPGQAPSFDIGVNIKGGREQHSVRLVSTGRQAYMDLDGRAYRLPASQLRRISAGEGGKNDASALKALGVDPRNWLRTPRVAGDDQVGGEPVTRVAAGLDVQLMMADLMRAAERSGQAGQIDPIPAEATDSIREAVKDAQFEVYASKQDGTLRRVTATAAFEAPGPQGKNVTGDVRFDLQVSGVARGPEDRRPAQHRALLTPRPERSRLGGPGDARQRIPRQAEEHAQVSRRPLDAPGPPGRADAARHRTRPTWHACRRRSTCLR